MVCRARKGEMNISVFFVCLIVKQVESARVRTSSFLCLKHLKLFPHTTVVE